MQLYDKIKIEAIKMAVKGLYIEGVSSKSILMESIAALREQYEWTSYKELLYKAICYIYAYIELGYPFQEGLNEFQKIVDYLGQALEELFPERIWRYTQVELSKSKIRNLIGRWNPHLQSMKIDEVVSDIYENVLLRKKGDYLYHTGKVIADDGKEMLWQQTYWLHVWENDIVFHDVIKDKYYVFE